MKNRRSDLHIHTNYSDGIHTVEETVLAAIEREMVSIGFSDHSYTPFDESYCMQKGRLEAYLSDVQCVKKRYGDQIEVYTGLEYDGFSLVDNRSDFDYIIGSCHYLQGDNGVFYAVDDEKYDQLNTINKYYQGDSVRYARHYFETYVQCMQRIRPDILGHLDLLVLFDNIDEENPKYKSVAIEALIASLEITPIFELNTRAFMKRKKNVPYPGFELLKEALEHQGKVILSSDSHQKGELMGHFDDAVEILKNLGYRDVMVFRNSQFQEVGI